MLARSKLNSIESKIFEALINSEISHEDFMTVRNSQGSDTEIINLIEEGKKQMRLLNKMKLLIKV